RWPPGRDGGDEPWARLVSAAEWPAVQAAAAASSLQAPVRWLTPHIWGHQGRLAAWAPLRHQLVPQSPTGCLTWGQGLRSARGPRLPGTRRVWRRPGRGGGWRWGPAAPGPGDLSACPRQVLETCVKNCGHRFHVLVANRDFVDSVLVKVISPKNSPPAIVQDKVLALIQAWADAFRSSPDLTGVVHTYEELKRKGVEFPTADLDALSPIHTPQRSVPEVDPAATVPRPQAQPKTSSSPYSAPPASYSAPQAPALSATGPITANSEQIARLRSELAVVRGNTKVLSEMLTEMVPGQEAASDLELLQELHRTCRAMQQRVVELVSRVSNEEVTEELLRVNDDLNNVFLRYERFERYRSGRSVQNASNGVLSDVTEDNLIDLGPGSPAVVSPTVGGVAPPSSLSSQLAGLDLGTESVSGALSSLQQCDPRDSFDMFAQTRGSNSEPRKTATLEDPPATGVLSSALDGQKPGSEVIPVAQPSVMDDIEVWLRTDLKGDDLEEGVTSEEFDKFLEERAKAAEMVPSLPSPPAEAPASNPSGRKKPERSEDALFAL
uniref:Target of myb1 like 2 membrane trafficking protein n=1 Tax=Sus scrofa TaxID=9823 RepID=A0A8D1E977_PIG